MHSRCRRDISSDLVFKFSSTLLRNQRLLTFYLASPMDTTGSGSSALSSVKRKNNINWGGAREGAGRKKKKDSSSASQTQPLRPSTQTLSAGNSHLASPLPLSQPTEPTVGFFAPRRPSVFCPVSNGNILGSSSVVNVSQADTGPQGARIAPEQGVLIFYCVVYHS